MTDKLHYFAYGSNMSTRRLRRRVAGAQVLCAAQLDRHCLVFHKRGQDNSAKCDIVFTGNPADRVLGVLYTLYAQEKPLLDRIEQLGEGYAEKEVLLCTAQGARCLAFTYYALDIDTSLKPYTWYKQHVLAGAMEHQLDHDYLRALAAVEALEDQDRQRCQRELAIYAKA